MRYGFGGSGLPRGREPQTMIDAVILVRILQDETLVVDVLQSGFKTLLRALIVSLAKIHLSQAGPNRHGFGGKLDGSRIQVFFVTPVAVSLDCESGKNANDCASRQYSVRAVQLRQEKGCGDDDGHAGYVEVSFS